MAPVPEADDDQLRVIVVDDEPDVRLMLRFGLEHAGLDVLGEAGDGAAAIELVGEVSPDAVVLDLLMPGTNGFEAIPEIRARYPGVGIVAYTAVAGDFVRSEMRRLNIPLVLKQSNSAKLVDALYRSVGRTPPETT